MTFSGMDVDSILDVATRLTKHADRLDQSLRAVDDLVRLTGESWRGPDVQQFTASWHNQHRRAAAQASTDLRDLAETARRNAEAQRTTSEQLDAGAGLPAPQSSGFFDDVALNWNWFWMSAEDKETALTNMAETYAQEQGIDPPPKVVWQELPAPPGTRTLGQYDPSTNTLTLNPKETGGYGDAVRHRLPRDAPR